MALRWSTKKIKIAGKRFEPKPLDLEGALEMCFLLSPYVPPEGDTIDVVAMFGTMAPRDITKAFMLLLGLPLQQLARANPQELMSALPLLSEINDFGLLFTIARDYA